MYIMCEKRNRARSYRIAFCVSPIVFSEKTMSTSLDIESPPNHSPYYTSSAWLWLQILRVGNRDTFLRFSLKKKFHQVHPHDFFWNYRSVGWLYWNARTNISQSGESVEIFQGASNTLILITHLAESGQILIPSLLRIKSREVGLPHHISWSEEVRRSL